MNGVITYISCTLLNKPQLITLALSYTYRCLLHFLPSKDTFALSDPVHRVLGTFHASLTSLRNKKTATTTDN